MKTILEALAKFAIGVSFKEIPKPVVHQANRCLLDFMGCYWGGLRNKTEPQASPTGP